jgi:hypothetical protein
MSVHWSDWVGLGLTIGIAIFMIGWYLKERVDRRRGRKPNGRDATDFTA